MIAYMVGFWSLFNRDHASLDIPLESHLEREGSWLEIPSGDGVLQVAEHRNSLAIP